MKLDTMRRHGLGEVVDAVVIGTGAGGAPLLARLAAAGLRVVALEAGRNREPEDYLTDEALSADLYWRGERLAAGETPQAFGANNSGIGIGGSTLHWGAFVPRVDARDLQLRQDSGQGRDWPIKLDELQPLYVELEAFLGVSGPAHYPWHPARHYPLPALPRNAPAQAMAMGAAQLGVATCDAPAAVVSQDFAQADGPTRLACVHCGYCHQGCRNRAKVSMDTTFLPLAVARGAEIRPGCFAHGLERDSQGRITAVLYRQDGREHRQLCAAVFLCAGAVETPRLLLHLGLGNRSGQVGRNYMAHVATQVWGTFAEEMRGNKGWPSSLMTEAMVRPDGAGFAGGYLIQSLGVVPQTWADGVARGRGLWGQALVDYIDRYNFTAGIGINGECLPYDHNCVTRSDEIDESGLPKPHIAFSYGENERRLEAHATRVMTGIWQAAGASDIWALPRSAHTIGTCRMGTDPDDAVVNPFGRSFDIDNLWICDNSVFPSSLAANPALTIMALSLRTAAAFLDR